MAQSSNSVAIRTCRVLVVDDDPIMRAVVPKRLLRLNCTSELAEDGRAAWDLARAKDFDLAIVDLDMPNIDGLTLIQCLRAFPATRHIPIVVCTTREDSADMQNALAAGASSYLLKPVNWPLFEPHIAQLLAASRAAKDARAELDACRRDLLELRGQLVTIAPKLEGASTALISAVDAGLCSDKLRPLIAVLDQLAREVREVAHDAPEGVGRALPPKATAA